MRKIVLVVLAVIFMATPVFAQRSLNYAQEAAKKAQERNMASRNNSSSQIEWLDNVIKVVNMDESSSKK